MQVLMFAILRGANGRRREVDFHDDHGVTGRFVQNCALSRGRNAA
jgi:hypothetical protein